jgi:hypothetical protein
MQVLSLYKYQHITTNPTYRHFTQKAARGRPPGRLRLQITQIMSVLYTATEGVGVAVAPVKKLIKIKNYK